MKIITAILLLLLLSPLAAAQTPLAVQFKPEVTMESDSLAIRDIVDPENTDLEFAQRYGSVKIAGLDTQSDKIDQSMLLRSLATAGADLDTIRFKKAPTVRLERGQVLELTPEQSELLKTAFEQTYNVPRGDVSFGSVRILPKIEGIAQDGFTLKSVRILDANRLERAKLAAVIEDFDGNRNSYTLFVDAQIETSVYTAADEIAAGDNVRAEQLVAGKTRLTGLSNRLVRPNELSGRSTKAARTLHKGDILLADALKDSELVKEGSVVTLSYKTPILNIKTQGSLVESAEIGALVKVENFESKRTVIGRLIAKDLVEVAHASR